jgi:ribosomal protein S18 acetylase RimI-like enzyme
MATPGDASLIAALLYGSFLEYESLYTREGFAATVLSTDQIRSRIGDRGVWVALYYDAIVGTVSAVPKDNGLYIRSMAVAPSARGRRVGELMLRQIESSALAEGYVRLTLVTTPFLTRAIRLYERFGFQRVDGDLDNLFGTPLIAMEKELRPRN